MAYTLWKGGKHAAIWRQTKQEESPRSIMSLEILELKPAALVTGAIYDEPMRLTSIRDTRIARVIRNAGTLPIPPQAYRRHGGWRYGRGFGTNSRFTRWLERRDELFRAAEEAIFQLDKESTDEQGAKPEAEGLRQGEGERRSDPAHRAGEVIAAAL